MGPQDNRSIMPWPKTAAKSHPEELRRVARRQPGRLTRGMRVTKHHHAALSVHESGKSLVIDPGSFTDPLVDLGDVVGIVLTHEHPDHWTPDHLDRLLRLSPDIPIFAPEGVAKAAPGYDITVVQPGKTVTVEPFTLTFYGGTHAVIHETLPIVD